MVLEKLQNLFLKQNLFPLKRSHPATRRRGDVVTTSLWTSQRRRRYVLNETPNNVLLERRQDVSVVHPHDVLLERRDNVLKGHSKDVSSLHLHDVSSKSQMKHPATSKWYVTKTSYCYVSTMSPVRPKWNAQMTLLWYLSTPPRFGITLFRRSTRSQVTLLWTQSGTLPRLI